jgi:hypothetical protein
MSRKELVAIVSRAFALLLATWVFVDITYLLDHLYPLVHHASLRSALSTTYDYWTIYYLTLAVLDLVRIVVLSLAAALFWTVDHGWRHSSQRGMTIMKNSSSGVGILAEQ